jgi:hypothetical protein
METLNRIAGLLTAAVTWIYALAVGLSAAAGEISEVAPEGSETVVAWITRAAVWLLAAWQTVRRVTPVLPAERGLLPVIDRRETF